MTAEDQHAPSTEQTGRCRECLESRHDDEPWLHAECADEREANASAQVEAMRGVVEAVLAAPFTSEDGLSRLKRIVAMASAASAGQQQPNTEQPVEVQLGVGEGRFSPGPLFDVGWNSRQPEVDSLRQQLDAAQAERDDLKRTQWLVAEQQRVRGEDRDLLRERDQLRAEVDWLNQEHADMHPACSAEPGHCPHEAEVARLRQRASDYEIAEGTAIAQRNKALNEALAYKYQAEAMRGVLIDLVVGRTCEAIDASARSVALAALDAASARLPATSTESHQSAPSANDSPTQAQPEVRNVGPSESRAGPHPAEAPGE